MWNKLTPEVVDTISDTEISRWLVRLDRIDLATSSNGRMVLGGMAGDDQMFDVVAKDALINPNWKQTTDYQDVMLYVLKPGIDYNMLKSMAKRLPKNLQFSDTDPEYERASKVGNIGLQDSLERVGIIEVNQDGVEVDAGAVAATCLKRSDIRKAVDRRLAERADVIEATAAELEARTKPRGYKQTIGSRDHSILLYQTMPYAEGEMLTHFNNRLGYNAQNGPELWQQELQYDLKRIDSASSKLATLPGA